MWPCNKWWPGEVDYNNKTNNMNRILFSLAYRTELQRCVRTQAKEDWKRIGKESLVEQKVYLIAYWTMNSVQNISYRQCIQIF